MTATWAATWPDHQLTLQEWEELPADEAFRLELVEGMLSIMPKPRSRHQNAATDATYLVKQQLPRHLIALADVEVVVFAQPLTLRVPDVVVTRTELYETAPARFDAADVLVAVEIHSDGTRNVDRILKFAEYAEAGIPQYWMIDVDGPVTLVAYLLIDGHYELSGEHSGSAHLDVAGHPVSLDLDALVRR